MASRSKRRTSCTALGDGLLMGSPSEAPGEPSPSIATPDFIFEHNATEKQKPVFARRRASLPYAVPKDYCPPFPIDAVGTFSNHGIQPDTKKGNAAVKMNQDRAGVEYPFLSPNLAAFAVFDGHGVDGAYCSDFAINRCVDEMSHGLKDSGFVDKGFDLAIWETVIKNAFDCTHKSLIAQESFATAKSGTTATVLLLGCSTPAWVAVANAGDSPTLCGRCVNGNWSAIQLSADHKPDEPHELARIARNGGLVKAMSGNAHAHVWLPNYQAALGMSRSLGDSVFHELGVISEPNLSCLKLTPDDRFLIVASDGVSEFISYDEMVFIVSQHENATDACTELVHQAMLRWADKEGAYRDDITCTVVMLEKALQYMSGEGGAEHKAAQMSNVTSLKEVALSDQSDITRTNRRRFALRRSIIGSQLDESDEPMVVQKPVEPRRDEMPPIVMRARRASASWTLSPDMDSGLDSVNVQPRKWSQEEMEDFGD